MKIADKVDDLKRSRYRAILLSMKLCTSGLLAHFDLMTSTYLCISPMRRLVCLYAINVDLNLS